MDIRIRDMDADVVRALRAQARHNGHSLSGEIRELLRAAAMRPRRELVASLTKHLASIQSEHGTLPDSTAGIRAERDGFE